MNKYLAGFLLVIFIIIAGSIIFTKIYPSPAKITYGVTFSSIYATYLGLNWQDTYIKIFDELKVKSVRIPSYWNIVEPQKGEYDFSQIDFMINEAGKSDAKVMLVLGMRQPRWPECHVPVWAKNLTRPDRQQRLLKYIGNIVERYKDYPQISSWQVENEPLLSSFGEDCDIPDKDFLQQEVKLVRMVSNKPIIMTDSGELGSWKTSMQLSDTFGTTLYRQVYNQTFGYVTYPIPPFFYNIKASLIRKMFAENNKKTIIAELQAEPWLAGGVFKSADEQAKLFTIVNFKNYVNYAGEVGFDEVYLWGVEWWYYMAENNHPGYLEYAKTLFR